MSPTPPPVPPLLGLDIETDTTIDGLDPHVGRVLAVAVALADRVTVFDDPDERLLLARVDAFLAGIAPGVVVTWNGGGFDLPYLATRAGLGGVELGLRLTLDPALDDHHRPLAGHAGAYRASWHGHRHLDAYRLYRAELGAASEEPCSLKAVARRAGLRPVEVDASQVHLLSRAECAAYVTSDARCTAELARRRWPGASVWVDPAERVGALR
ncbi:MAG TPA: 3'-5' exonuclease [Acidimicrobiales bacterium]